MPRVPVSYNVSDYSHSTVCTVSRTWVMTENAPPLVTRWVFPTQCRDRWMLVDNGDQTTTLGSTTYVQTRPPVVITITSYLSAAPAQKAIVVLKGLDDSEPSSQGTFVTTRFQYSVWSIDSNPLFKSCQPYNDMSLYSPGACPEGQTMAEITEIHGDRTDGGIETSWQASCCKSGMTFGSDVSRFCQSTITAPLVAHAFLTTSSDYSGAPNTSVYEWVTKSGGYSSTVSNMTSITRGLAVADPVVVAWALKDMSLFPPDYRTSVASKIGVTLAMDATPASTSSLPRETGSPKERGRPSRTLSTGAKAGIVVGVIIGVAFVFGMVAMLWLRHRRTNVVSVQQTDVPEMEDQDVTNAKKRWFLGGRWRTEADVAANTTQELDSKTVHVVPGPPAELDSREAGNTNNNVRDMWNQNERVPEEQHTTVLERRVAADS